MAPRSGSLAVRGSRAGWWKGTAGLWGASQRVEVGFAVLVNVARDVRPVLLTARLGTIGLAAVGTLFSAIASHTRAREVMLPVLLFPVIVPVLIGGVQATGLALGNPVARDMPWLSLLVGFDAG